MAWLGYELAFLELLRSLEFWWLSIGAEFWKGDATKQKSVSILDGLAIRNANRGDSHESTRRKQKKNYFITCERFARIASNLQFAIFSPPKRDSHKKKVVQFGNPDRNDSWESDDLRESANRFARIGPSKVRSAFHWKKDGKTFNEWWVG